MNEIELHNLQLRLLKGKVLYVDGIPIHRITLDEITDMGYDKYSELLGWLCLSEDNIVADENGNKISPFKFIVSKAYHDEDFLKFITNSLEIICKQDIAFVPERLYFMVGESYIEEKNFSQIQQLIRKRNCMESIEEDVGNPSNEMARRMLQRRKELRNKLKKAKENQNSGGTLNLADLISIFASMAKMDLTKVFEYDIFQFNDQFNRLRIFKDYEVNIQALIHGAKSEEVKLKHWMSKLKDDNEDSQTE